MEIVNLGQIYIKKVPRKLDKLKDVDEELYNQVDGFFESLFNMMGLGDNEEIMSAVDFVESSFDKDYSGCEEFWTACLDKQNKIKMITSKDFSENFIECFYTYDHIDDMKEVFMSLADFLKSAEYVGKHLKLNYKLDDIDAIRWGSTDLCPLVLYKTDKLALAMFSDKKYSMISPYFLEKGEYQLCGEVNEEYKDANKVYLDILVQLSNNQRRRS